MMEMTGCLSKNSLSNSRAVKRILQGVTLNFEVGGIRVPKSKDLVILEKVGFEGSKVGYWKWLHE